MELNVWPAGAKCLVAADGIAVDPAVDEDGSEVPEVVVEGVVRSEIGVVVDMLVTVDDDTGMICEEEVVETGAEA